MARHHALRAGPCGTEVFSGASGHRNEPPTRGGLFWPLGRPEAEGLPAAPASRFFEGAVEPSVGSNLLKQTFEGARQGNSLVRRWPYIRHQEIEPTKRSNPSESSHTGIDPRHGFWLGHGAIVDHKPLRQRSHHRHPGHEIGRFFLPFQDNGQPVRPCNVQFDLYAGTKVARWLQPHGRGRVSSDGSLTCKRRQCESTLRPYDPLIQMLARQGWRRWSGCREPSAPTAARFTNAR
jgi:hypothetical protein